jgi:hypothetical protein
MVIWFGDMNGQPEERARRHGVLVGRLKPQQPLTRGEPRPRHRGDG